MEILKMINLNHMQAQVLANKPVLNSSIIFKNPFLFFGLISKMLKNNIMFYNQVKIILNQPMLDIIGLFDHRKATMC
jgi:hypothetical protein